jgi:hypothetical protein
MVTIQESFFLIRNGSWHWEPFIRTVVSRLDGAIFLFIITLTADFTVPSTFPILVFPASVKRSFVYFQSLVVNTILYLNTILLLARTALISSCSLLTSVTQKNKMYSRQLLLAVLAALSVSAVPLNIVLGAYSPALVVGDGEISFGGSPERASEVLQTLASGAQNGAVPSGQTPPAPAAAPAGEGAAARPAGEGIQSAAAGTPASTITPGNNPEGVSSPLVSAASVEGDDAGSPNVSAVPALAGGESNQLPAEYISHAIANNRFPNMAKEKRYVVVPPTADAPVRKHKSKSKRDAAIAEKVKRDIDGFRAALQFARDAALTQPRIEVSFGVTQNAGVNVPANSAANGALPPGQTTRPGQEKRSAIPEPEAEPTDEKLGMTLIAISEI